MCTEALKQKTHFSVKSRKELLTDQCSGGHTHKYTPTKKDVTWIILMISLLCLESLDHVRILAVYGGSESSRNAYKYLNLCSEDEQRSYGFGTTWGWVINDRIFMSTIPLKIKVLHDAIEEPLTSEESFCFTKGSLWRKIVLQIIKS